MNEICFMCSGQISEDTWTIFWNYVLPICEENLYHICPGCYKKILRFIEHEHNQKKEKNDV